MIRLDSSQTLIWLLNDSAIGTTTQVSGTLDVSQYEGNALLSIAANGDANGTLDFTVKDSPDGTTYTAVGTEALFLPETGAGGTFAGINSGTDNNVQTRALNLDKVSRYVTVTLASGYTGSCHIVAIATKKLANFS